MAGAMDATFSVSADPSRNLIRIALSGFLTPEVTRRFLEARAEAHRRLRCAPNQHATVADLRGMAIQSQQIVERFGGVLGDPVYRSRRLALVTPSTLARMQVYRAAGNRDARFFTDPGEAEAWALEPGPPEGAAI